MLRNWRLTNTTRFQRSRNDSPRVAFRPTLESLEERAVPAAVYWGVDADGAWEVDRNWSTGRVPFPGDEVFLDRPSGKSYTITHGSGYHYAGTIQASSSILRITGGTLQVQSTCQLDGPLLIEAGSLTFQGVFTTTGDVLWTGGQIQSFGGRLHNTGTLTLMGPRLKTLDGINAGYVSLTNAGTIIHTDTGALQINTLNSMTNQENGVYDLQADASLLGSGSFSNDGFFVKSGGEGNSSFTPSFASTGFLAVGSGTLTFGDNPFYTFVQTAGATILYGGTLAIVTTLDIRGGRLEGFGIIDGNVRNAGILDVGGAGAAGYLQINGNYTQTLGGTVNLEITGIDAYDMLYVNGRATLNGTLNLSLLDEVTLAVGDGFFPLFFNERSGEFTTFNVPDLGPKLYFAAGYDEYSLMFWVEAIS